jgi:hypothetical protein
MPTMKMDWLTFWRTSFVVWLTLLLYFAISQTVHPSYPHPVMVLLPPLCFVILSALQIRRIKNRKN